MAQHVSALLIYDQSTPLESLKTALNDGSISAGRARTCEEARHLIETTEPHIIFTDTQLPDGTWADVMRSADAANAPMSVIVVSRNTDTRLYIKTMEAGAFDFIMPPFEKQSLDYVVRSALSNALTRRGGLMLAHAAH
jgi:DNA-binding NtrC family response regulator